MTHTGDCLISEAQLRALGLRPEAFTHQPLGTAGPQAVPARQVEEWGKAAQLLVSSWEHLVVKQTTDPPASLWVHRRRAARYRRRTCARCPEATAEHAQQMQKVENWISRESWVQSAYVTTENSRCR